MTELSAELPAAIDLLVRREAVRLEAATSPAFNIDVLEKAMTELAEIHQSREVSTTTEEAEV